MGTLHYDFENSVGYWVTMTSRTILKALNEELAPLGVTFAQVQVLGWIAVEQGLSQAELAQRMGIEPPTLAGLLDRMEKSRWIARRPCPSDRRRKLVEVGPAAGPVWSRITEAARRVRARATRGIPPARLREVKDTLERLRANLQQPQEAQNA